jgi:GH25 family lysozyme M1 (1,4-beta-N-acetylmuramidase)
MPDTIKLPVNISTAAKPAATLSSKPARPAKPVFARGSKPAGWWDYSSSGTRDGVTKDIQSKVEIPEPDKIYLLARIAAISADYNFIVVSAHFHISGNKTNLHMTTTGTKALV